MIFNLGQRCASRKLTTRPRTFSYLTAVRKNSVKILGQNKTICEGAHYLTGSHISQRTFCISLSRSRPWNVVFYGTDDFALETLKALHSESLKGIAGCVGSVDVVTATDRCPVYRYAEKNSLQTHSWPYPTDGAMSLDIGVVTSFGHLIPPEIIQSFPRGILNVHPSLLPRWRGAAPILHTILNGDKVTGVTITEISLHKFDVGPVLQQVTLAVPERCTSLDLSQSLARKGAAMLVESLASLTGSTEEYAKQKQEGAIYAPKMKSHMSLVSWESESCEELDRHYRALGVIYGLQSEWMGQKIRLYGMVDQSTMKEDGVQKAILRKVPHPGVVPGTPVFLRKQELICIRCKDGWVGFTEVNYKKPMSATAFFNGYLSKGHYTGTAFTSMDTKILKYLRRNDKSS